MTASRPDIRPFALALALTAFGFGVGAAFAQDSGTDAAAQAEDQAAQEQPADKPTETYFVGVGPKAKRQIGPSVGQPVSILPKPFVPFGSVTVPPAPEMAAADTGDAATVDTQETELGEVAAELATDQPVADESAIMEGELDLLDPSGASAANGALYGRDFWQGYGRADILANLSSMADAASSPAAARIVRSLVGGGMALPAPTDDGAIDSFLDARLSLLQAMGDRAAYVQLIARLPKDRDWTSLARHQTNAFLIGGQLADACALAEAVRASDSDPYWVRMAAFCRAARGDRIGVDFQLGILEEMADVRQGFYQLIDQILIEAEKAAGSTAASGTRLGADLKVDLLEAAMARLARAGVETLALDGINPLAVEDILGLTGVSRAARLPLVATAMQKNWIDGAAYADFALSAPPAEDELSAAIALAGTDDRFEIDATLASALGTRQQDAARLSLLSAAWMRAGRTDQPLQIMAAVNRLVADVTPSAANADFAVFGLRAALAAGDETRARAWFTLMRASEAGLSDPLDRALVDAAPIMTVAGQDAPHVSAAGLWAWWRARGELPEHFEQANLLFTLLEALGETVPETLWTQLEEGPVRSASAAPATAPWRRMLLAAAQGDRPQVLVQAIKLMSDGGPQHVTPALAGSVVSTLRAMGFEREARAFATEMLLAQGL